MTDPRKDESIELNDYKDASGKNGATIYIDSNDNEVEYLSDNKDASASTDFASYAGGRPGKGLKNSHVRRFIDSFKRPVQRTLEDSGDYIDSAELDYEEALENGITTSVSPNAPNLKRLGQLKGSTHEKETELKQTIRPRHVIMISLGTGIGTGLLVGNGTALKNAGPAGLVLGYGIMGSIIYCIIQATGEMAIAYSNLPGGYNVYPSFLVDKGLGFAVAWVYCIQWLTVCPLELVTASLTIKYWTTTVNSDIFVVIFYVLIIVINVFGAKGYAEAEFFCNCCKVLMMIGFFILSIVTTAGGAGNDGYLGGTYWHTPGAFRGDKPIDHFKGICGTLVTAAFAYGGTEFLALTAAEQSNPRKAIPSAAKKVLYRIICVYLLSIIMLGFLVPYDSPRLLGSSGSATSASPYVLAASLHGVRVVPHFINAVILISVLSVGNSAFYSSSRLLMSLARQGYAPKWFDYIDREGRPSRAMLISALFGVIAFCAASPKETEVFTWLLAISGLSQLFTWCAICLSHIRFRAAMQVQGRPLGELGFMSQTGVWGSWYALFMMFLIYIAQFWVAIAPIGSDELSAENFFENYLAMPILIALYLGYKIYYKDWTLFIKAEDIDLVSHRQIFDEDLLKEEDFEYQQQLKNGPMWKRVVNFWC